MSQELHRSPFPEVPDTLSKRSIEQKRFHQTIFKTRRIHEGGSDGASYCEPKKIHEPEIFHQKIPGIKISNPKKYKA